VDGKARVRDLSGTTTSTDQVVTADATTGELKQAGTLEEIAATNEPWYGTDDDSGATTNTEDIYITGNIGVGTATLTASKVATFAGDVDIQGVLDPTKLIFSGDGSVGSFNPTSSDQYEIEFQEGRDLEIKSNTTNNILHIQNDGNVGIGLNNPNKTLTIHGSFAAVDDPNNPVPGFVANYFNNFTNFTGLLLKKVGTGSGSFFQAQSNIGTVLFNIDRDGDGYFHDKVSVGTTTKTHSFNVGPGQSSDAVAHIEDPTTGIGGFAGLTLRDRGNADADAETWQLRVTNNGQLGIGELDDAETSFQEHLTLDQDGEVGIGTTNPTDDLHVDGDVRITGAIKDSSNNAGSAGQVLSATSTGTAWVNPTPLSFVTQAEFDNLDTATLSSGSQYINTDTGELNVFLQGNAGSFSWFTYGGTVASFDPALVSITVSFTTPYFILNAEASGNIRVTIQNNNSDSFNLIPSVTDVVSLTSDVVTNTASISIASVTPSGTLSIAGNSSVTIDYVFDNTIFSGPSNASGTVTATVDYGNNLMVSSGGVAIAEAFPGGTFNGLQYNVVVSGGGRRWLDRNLGATTASFHATHDANARGWLYQWGRPSDGHQLRNSPTTSTLAASSTPGHNQFIATGNNSWQQTADNTLWDDSASGGPNNVCPFGFRLPTSAEWTAEFNSWNTGQSNYLNRGYGSSLRTVTAGSRNYQGNISNETSHMSFWTSTPSGNSSRGSSYTITSSNNNASTTAQVNGYSVRCIQHE
jgi:uncharacterized protein (TIGR02145 family)